MGGNAEKEDTEMADAAGAVISTADKSKKRVRKQRKVTRKEKTKNEKGYIGESDRTFTCWKFSADWVMR